MKKKLCSMVCLCYFVSIMLCACGRKEQGNPIRLPAREDIVSIGVSDGDKYAISPNTEGEATEFIDEFLSMLMDMETTSQQSINDAPVNKDSITININCDGAAGTTLFYYVDAPQKNKRRISAFILQPVFSLRSHIRLLHTHGPDCVQDSDDRNTYVSEYRRPHICIPQSA